MALTCRNQAAAGKKEIWQWTRNRDRLEYHSFPPPRRLHRAVRSSKSRLRVRRKAERARAPCSGNYERTFSNKKNPLSTARFLSGRGKEWLTYLALDTGNTFRAVCGPADVLSPLLRRFTFSGRRGGGFMFSQGRGRGGGLSIWATFRCFKKLVFP